MTESMMKGSNMNRNHPGIASFSALILASGLSERMGRPKPLLMWDQSRTFLEKIIGEYVDAGCTRVVCTVNSKVLPYCKSIGRWKQVKFLLNEHPEWGRMYSVKLGLSELGESEWCFIQNVDNPYIDQNIIKGLIRQADPVSWCSPGYHGMAGHPVLLPKNIIIRILQEQTNDAILQDILNLFPRKNVEMKDDAILRNINTPEDYNNFLREKR